MEKAQKKLMTAKTRKYSVNILRHRQYGPQKELVKEEKMPPESYEAVAVGAAFSILKMEQLIQRVWKDKR